MTLPLLPRYCQNTKQPNEGTMERAAPSVLGFAISSIHHPSPPATQVKWTSASSFGKSTAPARSAPSVNTHFFNRTGGSRPALRVQRLSRYLRSFRHPQYSLLCLCLPYFPPKAPYTAVTSTGCAFMLACYGASAAGLSWFLNIETKATQGQKTTPVSCPR